MPLVLMILIVGAAAGFLATRLMRVQTDILTTVLLGVAGAGIAWVVLRVILLITRSGFVFVGGILGAMALIWIWQKIVSR